MLRVTFHEDVFCGLFHVAFGADELPCFLRELLVFCHPPYCAWYWVGEVGFGTRSRGWEICFLNTFVEVPLD